MMRVAAFEHYLRTGRVPNPRLDAGDEVKFNHNHDRLGRFTFSGGAVGMSRAPSIAPPRSRIPSTGRSPAPQPSSAAPRRRAAAEIPGYPESGRTSWRSANDYAFAAAANHYNRKYNLKPGADEYKTPEFLKAWAMRESGGEGDHAAFTTDPFQVNKPRDWAPEKARLGLQQGQKMTPAVSAYAALEWLRQKSFWHDGKGGVRRLDTQGALERYNHRKVRSRESGQEMHYVWYARTIMQMARAATAKERRA
ncbi:MAG: hypothetical protein ABIP41_04445 [Croceibacterium sp.]